MNWAEQRARLLSGAVAEPPVKDVAYWMSRCYRDGCHNEPSPTPDPRWRGTYCQPCQTTVLPSLVYAETDHV